MSKYTTEVRFICETSAGLSDSEGYNSINTIIANSRAKIFDFSYPIFDENYRATLETKILKHYYTREIGLETVGQWKHFLDMRMNEIMPFYNKMYLNGFDELNLFYDTDYTREGTRNDNEDRTESGTSNDKMTGTVADVGTNSRAMTGTVGDAEGGTQSRSGSNIPKKSTWDLYSDTPQGGIAGIQSAEDDPSLNTNAYLTNARHIIEDGTGSTDSETTTFGKTNTRTYNTNESGTDNNTRTYNTNNAGETEKTGTTVAEGEYFEHIKGKRGSESYVDLLTKLKETFFDIDMLIIDSLSDLFMNIY